ncbi:hypothetical protein [Halomonas cerina]|uniref:UTP-glucose-1-phosphate uridylyltransferase n=1 Tax=Halomonas cerina TaxID=447424 RepID=A0A839VAW1_9GAMM|nr:hypothetical protein [Halomonas cerina]MBB3192622.1 UTP-glucose-1-phosphate uridylyltransferase [Halomonas cerina]
MTLLADTPPGAGGEIQPADAIAQLIRETGGVDAFRMRGRTFDCGQIKGWLQANQVLGMEAGYLAAPSRDVQSTQPEPEVVD